MATNIMQGPKESLQIRIIVTYVTKYVSHVLRELQAYCYRPIDRSESDSCRRRYRVSEKFGERKVRKPKLQSL